MSFRFKIALFCSWLLLLTGSAAAQEAAQNEPYVSFFDDGASVIFSGTLSRSQVTPVPAHEFELTAQDEAQALTFQINRVWKGPKAKRITVYMTTEKNLFCNTLMPDIGKAYIIRGHWDKAQKYLIITPCGDIGDDNPERRKELDREFPR
jgi:hypothetical protein